MEDMTLAQTHPLHAHSTHASRLVRALRGDRPDVTPVWFMRQAGRSLPEYRSLRVGTKMLDSCFDPAMASEITMQPVRRHHTDAGIFFSDIVVPLKAVGVDVRIEPGRGPVFDAPFATASDIAKLTAIDPAVMDELGEPIWEGVRRTVAMLHEVGGTDGAAATPLIGFAGAPFTLAAYLVEGGPSKDHLGARALMHTDPAAWQALMAWTAEVTGRFLRGQVLAGASAAQLFDSWAGSLSARDYAAHVMPASAAALTHVRDLSYVIPAGTDGAPAEERAVPTIHFGVGTGELLTLMHDIGVDAIGVDYRITLEEAERRLGGNVVVQGNLDPALLAAPPTVLEAAVTDVLESGKAAPAHIFNLGHGVPPGTDPDVLTRIVELVHSAAV
jgi:uroporphyrinogen decarboxylase